ncbi:MAG: AAA family ATPase [Armatimonadetes bacterium]|nr:AAA family ATPase [Armatimonadota bacterium]
MKLTCIAGVPGTGKTHLARRLETETGAVRLSRDDIRAELFDPVTYSESEKGIACGEMLLRAKAHLQQGMGVILEGMPFSRRSERDAARSLAREAGADFELILCVCPEEVALERITAQVGDHPATDRSTALYFEVKSRFEAIGEDEVAIVIR